MTARVVADVGADALCVVEAESRPSLVNFNTSCSTAATTMACWSTATIPAASTSACTAPRRSTSSGSAATSTFPTRPTRQARVLPRLPRVSAAPAERRGAVHAAESLEEPVVLLRRSGSFAVPPGHRGPRVYDRLRAAGAELVAILGDFNKGPDPPTPSHHPPDSPLFDPTPWTRSSTCTTCPTTSGPRPGSFQSCTLRNRLDYILLSPDLAAAVDRRRGVPQGPLGHPHEHEQAASCGDLPGDHLRHGTPRRTTRRSWSRLTCSFYAWHSPSASSACPTSARAPCSTR